MYESEGLCVLCVGVRASPLIFIDVSKGFFGWQTRGAHMESTLRSNGEAPRAGGKAVAPKLVRLNHRFGRTRITVFGRDTGKWALWSMVDELALCPL
jgi:hypothetical protein